MKVLSRIFVVLVVILAVVYACLWGFINVKGKDLLEEKVKGLTSKKISVDSLRFLPPLGISINNLSSDNARAKKINLSLSLLRVITGTAGFNTILIRDAYLGIVREGGQVLTPIVPLPAISKEPSAVSGDVVEKKGLKGTIPFFVKQLRLENVTVDFKDKFQGEDFQGSLYGVNAKVNYLSIPLDNKIIFSLTSAFKVEDLLLENNLNIGGWMDFDTKSMDATLEVKRVPYGIFSVYYPKNWKPDNLGIEEAIFSLKSVIKAEDNDLTAEGTLSLINHKFREDKEESTRVSMVKAVLGMFNRGKEYPEFDFKFKTKFDDPNLDFSVIQAQAQSKMKGITVTVGKEIVKEAAQIPTAGVEKAVDVAAKAVGEVLKTPERAKDIMKEAGKTLKSIFTEEEEEESQEQEQQPQE